MSRRVAVIGSGAAGAAAAHAATRRGAVVTVIDRGPGATALGSGAVDGVPDDASAVAPFLADLGLWEMARDEARVATTAGALRAVCGRDRAVLDLANVPPGPVAVIDGGR
ncbi:MAG TPA: FAD-dependent oxidoreductase, partial [Polyangiaceae bacterium]|nr:FAD-dependent oxidoreductase [Polyangiaceae bacterium]